MTGRILIPIALAGSLLALASPVLAQSNTDDKVLSLSSQEKAKLLDQHSEASVDAARAGLPGSAAGRGIHGEVGALIGTNGARAIYGTAAIPLGDNAGAVVSFEKSHFGHPH
jgi:hypothetical protein